MRGTKRSATRWNPCWRNRTHPGNPDRQAFEQLGRFGKQRVLFAAVILRLDLRPCGHVELRFFGGLSVEETAAALKVSPETVMHDWKLAKAWLLLELSGEKRDEP